jgi:hypothetical protein
MGKKEFMRNLNRKLELNFDSKPRMNKLKLWLLNFNLIFQFFFTTEAHVCNAMIMSMAIETAYSIDDQQKHDISVQTILDCFVPDKCFSDEERESKGCTMYSIFQ